jgi:TfoX/Sxy family transcriptional regulator of competence genes
MAYDEKIAKRLSKVFSEHKDVKEKKMFGGIAYMFKNYMCVGVINDLLMVRVGPEHSTKTHYLRLILDLWTSPGER